MSNIAKVFKDEVARISRHEAKQAVAPFRKSTTSARRTFADLKRRVAALEKSDRQLRTALAKVTAAIPQPHEAPVETQKARITGKGMRSLRRKLRLTRADFAKLVGLTTTGVYLWERKNGPLRVRTTTKAAILSVRGLSATEAKARLAEMKPVKQAGKRGRRKGRK